MKTVNRKIARTGWTAAIATLVMLAGNSGATPLSLPDLPLFLPESVPPLNMIVLGRDHKLYYEAYNDASDLNGDGELDLKYKPTQIDYFGYFDSYKCYTYNNGVFVPQGVTANKKCSNQWSGDFLNYLTTARIDALRKVLYGGYRSTDGTGASGITILERTHIPQDAHSWGKEYSGLSDGYDIREYSPLALPTDSRRHLFANTTPRTDNRYAEPPRLRFLLNRTNRVWNWVSKEQPVAGDSIDGGGGVSLTLHTNDLYVRVQVCVPNLLEPNCQRYPDGNFKPIGLLQEFGENDAMYFGLLSGSYGKNTSGGVLRRNVGSIRDEVNVDTDGTFKTNFSGIIATMNGLRVTGFGPNNYQYSCGWIATRAINPGECQMWGNPIGEMMYETLRYFAGRASPTSTFRTGSTGEATQLPTTLPTPTWDNPYANRPMCSKPFQTVVSDINPSYDSDELPGTAFGSFSGDTLGGMNVSALGDTIWNHEIGGSKQVFIGQAGAISDGAPTPKAATSFGNIRGLAPEEPTKLGSYYSASVAYHGRTTNLNSLNDRAGKQQVNTFAVALASPLPRIDIPVGDRMITLVPFAKSVGGYSINKDQGQFQPTNQIVDFYIESLTPTNGRFRVNFEDVEQGADHDMDAIAIYEYVVNSNGTVSVTVTSEYAAGGIIQHMGYVVSGSTADGTYLVVRDVDTTTDVDYFLDTPPAFTGTPPAPSTGVGRWNDSTALPLTNTRSFSPGTTTAATLLKNPLWYAAKWGGFDESFKDEADRNNIPDVAAEWDADGNGDPDNYFLVTNALKLSEQLRKAFQDILRRTTSSSSASVNSGSISSDTRVYQARFNTGEWTGQLLSYQLNQSTGALVTPAEWDASQRLPAADSRQIITVNSNRVPTRFRWDDLDNVRQAALGDATAGPLMLNYLRGDPANEGQGADAFRERRSKLGDIVSSSPLFVGRPPFRYRDSLQSSAPYSTFATTHANRRGVVYVGANDGMLHAFDAEDGDEIFAFIPSPVFNRLPNLASQNYSHQFYVDGSPSMGDVFFNNAWHTVLVGGLNKGGQGIYALDVTDPAIKLRNAESNAGDIVLWEFTDADDADLGLTYSQPAIVKLKNGRWAAVFGNGYNSRTADGRPSATGNAVLFIKEFGTGTVYKLDTGVGIAQAPAGVSYDNGLSTPALVDFDGDRVVEAAYAGDLYGNMWKFDLSSSNPSEWAVAFTDGGGNPRPLYQAKDADGAGGHAQPITGRPEVARGPGGAGAIVLFGTGKYLVTSDKLLSPTRVQTFYGIVDRGSAVTSGRAGLTQQVILAETSVDLDGKDGPLAPMDIRVSTDRTLGTNSGWYIDLVSPVRGYQGEKQVSNPIVRNGNVIFTTLIPDEDPCAFGGGSWIMELNLLDGSRLKTTPFDLNNDGQFTDADQVTVTLADGTTITVPVSGIGSTEGILQSPGVIDGEAGPEGQGRPVQYKYLPGSSGNIQRVTENPGVSGTGRQSWRQIR